MLAGKHHLICVAVALASTSSCRLSHTIASEESPDSSAAKSVPSYVHELGGRTETIQGTYRVEGTRLVVQLLPRDSVIESRYCLYSSSGSRDSLLTSHDTVLAFDTLAWSLRQDSLFLSSWQETWYTTLDSIPTITEWVYARKSGASGTLNGSFRMVGMRDRFLKALPVGSYDSVTMLKTWNETRKQFSEIQTQEVAFEAGRLVSTAWMVLSWADLALLQWNGGYLGAQADSNWYDVDLRKIDDTTVSETGRRTHEVVTRRKLRSESSLSLWGGDITYSSTDTSHHSAILHENPTSCPDGAAWFGDFRMDNWKRSFASRRSSVPSGKEPNVPTFPARWGLLRL